MPFGDLLAGSMDEEGIGSVVAGPFAVTLTMCVTVKENALKEDPEPVDVCADTQTGVLTWYSQVGDKALKTQETHLWRRLSRREDAISSARFAHGFPRSLMVASIIFPHTK